MINFKLMKDNFMIRAIIFMFENYPGRYLSTSVQNKTGIGTRIFSVSLVLGVD